ncbi:MAG: NUDIX hydrolase [Myxococcota bacterium]
MEHDGGWKRLASRYLFRSSWFSLRQDDLVLPGGEQITYSVVEHPGYAMVVPLLADGRAVMEQVFRHTVQRTLLECPSGGLDGEAPEVAARRELEEETGYRAGRLESLGSYFGSAGISSERYHLYLATELEHSGRIRREPTEQIELELIPLEELRARVFRGEIPGGPSALAILLAHAAVTARPVRDTLR